MCQLSAEWTHFDALTCLDLLALAAKSTRLDLSAPVVDLSAPAAKSNHPDFGSGAKSTRLD